MHPGWRCWIHAVQERCVASILEWEVGDVDTHRVNAAPRLPRRGKERLAALEALPSQVVTYRRAPLTVLSSFLELPAWELICPEINEADNRTARGRPNTWLGKTNAGVRCVNFNRVITNRWK